MLDAFDFLRLFPLKEFLQTFLIAEIIISSLYSFSNGSPPWNIGLAIAVLDKFFWLRFPAPSSPPHGHVFNEVVKNRVKEEKKEDE